MWAAAGMCRRATAIAIAAAADDDDAGRRRRRRHTEGQGQRERHRPRHCPCRRRARASERDPRRPPTDLRRRDLDARLGAAVRLRPRRRAATSTTTSWRRAASLARRDPRLDAALHPSLTPPSPPRPPRSAALRLLGASGRAAEAGAVRSREISLDAARSREISLDGSDGATDARHAAAAARRQYRTLLPAVLRGSRRSATRTCSGRWSARRPT